MSGEESDEEASVWDEIEEFTSADPAEEEHGSERVVDAEIVDSDEQSSSGSRLQADDIDEQNPSNSRIQSGDSVEHSSTGNRIQPGDTEPVADEERRDERESATEPPQTDREPLGENATREPHPDRDADPQTADPQTSDPPVDDVPAEAEDAPDADEAFDEMDVSDIDGEALWDELAGGTTAAADAGTAVEPGASEPSVEQSATGSVGGQPTDDAGADVEETLVDKRQYCQQCPHFTDPPDVGCTHPGTTIVEVVEDGRFRVRDCPVVTETGPDRTILDGGD